MTRRLHVAAIAGVVGLCTLGAIALEARQTAASRGRPLAIEDYYRVQSVGGPQFSPDSRWILFTVTTRVEENQGSRSESYVVGTDGAALPVRLQHAGRDVSGAAWTPENRVRYTAEQQTWAMHGRVEKIAA